MARMKNGTYTGQLDSNYASIKVGDIVKCNSDGIKYKVDGYAGIFNRAGARFPIKGWNPSEFTIVESCAAEEPAAESIPFEVNEEFQESIEAAEKAITDAEVKPASAERPALEQFSDEELAAELTLRGYAGKVTKVVNLCIG